MKSLLLLLCCCWLLTCSRQPVRVAATPPTYPAPAATATPAVEPTPSSRPTAEEVQAVGLEREDNATVPDKASADPTPPSKRKRPATQPNETAIIENQGNIGRVPLNNDDPADPALPVAAPLMTFSKSACYGDCAAYTLQLLPGNLLVLDVSNGLMGEGSYQRQLDNFKARELAATIDSLRSVSFLEFYPTEEEPPTDLQFTRLALPDKEDNLRSVTVYYDAPPALERFIDRIEALVATEIWKPRQYARE